jgi:putative protease
MTTPASPLLAPPELVAPAGDEDCVRAAVANGADAVYFGLTSGLNARARATNFGPDDLPRVMDYLHRRQVKGYVTLNTLVFTSELAAAEQTIRQVAAAGVDAIVVQDLGVARLARAISADLPIHASTQMSLTSAEGIRAVEQLNIARVILARELALDEIAKIRRQTTVPLEVFVHGALCVAYSGQCMTSESLGGRSANRGECAQACRMPYELICDGKPMDLGDVRYLLSPQDLAAYDLIPQLIGVGVNGFKIEGRLKTAEYVANITRYYRQAIDTAWAGRPVEFTPKQVEEMELSFSRGFSHGWLEGCNHKALVPGLSSAKRGVLLGRVKAVRRGRVLVELHSSVQRGDGVVFESGDEEQALGGRVYEIFQDRQSLVDASPPGAVELAFRHGSIDGERLRPGQAVWKTDDPHLASRLRQTFEHDMPHRRLPLDLAVRAEVGRPLQIEVSTPSGVRLHVESPEPLVEARKHPITEALLREQLGRLGGTLLELRTLHAEIVGNPMIPLSVLGKLRREMLEQLDAATNRPPARQLAEGSALASLRAAIAPGLRSEEGPSTLHVLCRSLYQLQTMLDYGVRSVLADFADLREYRQAVEAAHATGATILVAPPRIQKPGEAGIFRAILKYQPDGILARNLAGMRFYAEQHVPFVADFSLNAANELSVHYLRQMGAQRVTASYDLNREQLLDLVTAVPPEWLEVVIHQHMPMFHMEHCVFCAVLSPGTNKTNCGRPCDRHRVHLRDHVGAEHRLTSDVGCRNTLFNATPQSAAEAVPSLLSHGVRQYRIDLLDDAPPDDLIRVVRLYEELLAGRLGGKEVWRQLKAANRVGVTRGSMEERRNPLAIL